MATSKKYMGECPYCKEIAVYPNDGVHMSKTKRKSVIVFHAKCFKDHGTGKRLKDLYAERLEALNER